MGHLGGGKKKKKDEIKKDEIKKKKNERREKLDMTGENWTHFGTSGKQNDDEFWGVVLILF